MGPAGAVEHHPLSYRDLRGAQRHFRGKLRKAELHAEKLSCVVLRFSGGVGISSSADTDMFEECVSEDRVRL